MSSLKALFRRSSTRDDRNGKKDEGKVFTYNAAELKLHRPLTYVERELSEFDELLRSSWDKAMYNGVMRYDLSGTKMSVLPGKYGFMVQENPKRFTDRRKPDNIQNLKQSFDRSKFNFTQVQANEILFELRETSRGKENNMIIVNVSPIEYGHVLLVPKLKACQPQVFTEDSLRFAVEVVALSNHRGFCLLGNTLLSYASVNHLHFHTLYFEYFLMAMTTGAKMFQGPVLELERYPVKGVMIQTADGLAKLAQIGHKVISLLYDMGLPCNIVICYGKPQISVSMSQGHSYLRMLVFPRKPVTGFKQLYDSDTRPPMFCAACELAGCVILLDNGFSDSLTETKVIEEMRVNEISEAEFETFKERLKVEFK